MNEQIRELQEKAFAGDKEALELYNEFVNKGEAPALRIDNPLNQKKEQTMYNHEELEGKRTYFDGTEVERPLTSLEKMMMGYNPDSTQKKEVNINPNDIKEKKETKQAKEEAPKTDNRSPLEKMIAGLS